jgi:fructose-1-phosphate kinase PfkB-like protein
VQSWEKLDGTPKDIIFERWHPGGGGNLAAGFSALGATTTVVGAWGGWHKDILEYTLAAAQVRYDGMVVAARTPVFEKDYTQDGTQIARRNLPSIPLSDDVYDALCAKIKKLAPAADLIVVADYDEWGHGVVSRETLAQVVQYSCPIFGTSRVRADKFESFDYVVAKSKELRGLSPESFIRRTGCERLIVTMDDKGSALYEFCGNGSSFQFNVPSRSVSGNSCGAGDSFFAAFALSILAGATIKEAMQVGNAAGRCCVRKPYGAHAVTLAELEEEMSEANC